MEKRTHNFNSKLKKKILKSNQKKTNTNIHDIPNLINVLSKENFLDNSIINKTDIRKTISHTSTSRRFNPNLHIIKEKRLISKEKHKNNYFNTLSRINECNRSTLPHLTKINSNSKKKPKNNYSKENTNRIRQKQVSPMKNAYVNNTVILNSFSRTKYVDISLCDETKCLISTGLNLKRKNNNMNSTNDSFYFNKKNLKSPQARNFLKNIKNQKIRSKNTMNLKCNLNILEKVNTTKSPKANLKLNKFVTGQKDSNFSKNKKSNINKKECDNSTIEKLKEKLKNINLFRKLNETSCSQKKLNKTKQKILQHRTEMSTLPQKFSKKTNNNIQKCRQNVSSKPTNFSSFFASEKNNISNKNQYENIENKLKYNIIDERLYNLFDETYNIDRGEETETQEFESKFLNYDLLESSKNNIISNLQKDELLWNNTNRSSSKLLIGKIENQFSHNVSEYEKPAEEMELIANEILNNSNILNKKLIEANNKNIKSNNVGKNIIKNVLNKNKIMAYDTEELKEGEGIQKIFSICLTDKK